jgi:hypothetical protein
MNEDLLSLFEKPIVIETYNNHKKLVKKGYPYLNYFGINFCKDNVISLKFYFPIFNDITENEAKLFLPHTKDFNKYIHYWEPSHKKSIFHTGCTFEIKFKGNEFPVKGFHFRLKPIKQSFDLTGYPKNIQFNLLEKKFGPGINFEYEKEEVLKKTYFYFSEKNRLSFFAEKFNNQFVNKIDLVEYTESNRFTKANFWKFDTSDENLNRSNKFTNKNKEIINYFNHKFGLTNVSDGYYEKDEVMATYFFNLDISSNSPLDSDNINTLKNILEYVRK